MWSFLRTLHQLQSLLDYVNSIAEKLTEIGWIFPQNRNPDDVPDGQTITDEVTQVNDSVNVPKTNNKFPKPTGHEYFLNNKKFSDVEIHTKSKTIHAHKVILSGGNDFFAGLFHEDSVDSIHCEDFDYEVMLDAIRFIYTGKVHGLVIKAKELFIVADEFKIGQLKNKCERYLCKTLNAENFSDLINFAERHNAHLLKEAATSLLRRKTNRSLIK
ncbi:hypothetical protein QAD02_012076 [Eretmocerus hayati]|uniref:Uncharacterized protein n=1 Tax=Eretmocerus hayati TaxID=131215 RepID=A0ACC2NYZ3_9HYME|nr:hypothetical protein QAD02_012076 [Eretmocerus hayati]